MHSSSLRKFQRCFRAFKMAAEFCFNTCPVVYRWLLHSLSICPAFYGDWCTRFQHLLWGFEMIATPSLSTCLDFELAVARCFKDFSLTAVARCFKDFSLTADPLTPPLCQWLLHPVSAPDPGFAMTTAPSLSTSLGVWVDCCTVFQGFCYDCCTLSQHLSWGLSRLLHGVSRV